MDCRGSDFGNIVFYNVGPITFQKNIVLNFHHLVCAEEYILGPFSAPL